MDKKLKVAMITRYPIQKDIIDGGVDAVAVYLCQALSKDDTVELHIVTFKDNVEHYQVDEFQGVIFHILPNQSMGLFKLFSENLKNLKTCLENIHPDIVHAQGAGMYGYLTLKTKRPSIVTFHGIIWEDAKYVSNFHERLRIKLFSLICESYCKKNAQHIISINPYVKEYFGNKISAKQYFIANPVKDNFFEYEKNEIQGRILFAGKIIPRKGVYDLIKAICLLKDQAKISVILAGSLSDEKYVKRVKEVIALNKIERSVQFLGILDEDNLGEEFSKCVMVVLPSYQETAPMVIQQAMAAGKPVIASNVGGIPYQIEHGETGFLFECGDIEKIAEYIQLLLANNEMREKMGLSARKKAIENYHADIVAEKTIQAYKDVLANR